MTVHVQRLPATGHYGAAPTLVLIHGWGLSSAVWLPWLPWLRPYCHIHLLDLPGYGASGAMPEASVESVMEACLAVLPERAVYVGYSLGGMLATRIAATYPRRVQGVVTLASNARFVADADWPWAMSEDDFAGFAASLAHPVRALKRFAGLQARGGDDEKNLLQQLRGMQESVPQAVLETSLRWLRELDLRPLIGELSVPARFCFAGGDALVPVVAARGFPAGQRVVIDGAPHALFLSRPRACSEHVRTFLQEQALLPALPVPAGTRDKRDVARSFSRAAASYDAVASLQRQVGETLLQRIPPASVGAKQTVVDLGCGTGYFLPGLGRQCPGADVVGVDLAEGMVAHAASHRQGGRWLCGDAENLPLAEHTAALVFASLTIQWCEYTDALFGELYRVLRPGGRLVFATLGPDTLHELRQAWSEVDGRAHVNHFLPWSALQESMVAAGFEAPATPDQEYLTLEYTSLRALTAELKDLGAHNVNSGRPAGLTGKRRMADFIRAYERQRNARGQLPASYQVWYCTLVKPQG